jgi:hypothetical protein
LDNAVVDTNGVQLLRGLVGQLATVHDKYDMITATDCIGYQGGCDNGLAGSTSGYRADTTMTGGDFCLDAVQDVGLVGTQLGPARDPSDQRPRGRQGLNLVS